MNIEEIRDYFISKKGTTESTPFDEVTLVFKVKNKMYGLMPMNKNVNELSINVKCAPEKAIELREKYPFVLPGYHMSKLHWNTIMVYDALSKKQITKWIDDSYDLIVAKLPKKIRIELESE